MVRLRSVLFAPASEPELVRKMPMCKPDAVVIDLEDSVPVGLKEAARAAAAGLVSELAALDPGLTVLIRVNSHGSPWFDADIDTARRASGLHGVVVPKVEDPGYLALIGMPTIAGVETARGIMDVRRLLGPPVFAAYFGAEDFVSDLGGRRTRAGQEVLYARSRLALAARIAGIQALDQVVVDFRDDERFRAEAESACDLGYLGKLCIHPRQVALANDCFTPTAEDLERSRQLVAAFAEEANLGRGAFLFGGQMVDAPMLRRAKSIVERARD
jgi:citrate lyase subunit beta/citryl-CoA lyase